MEYSLLENGIDSLKKAKTNIEEFEKYHQESSYHFLKDAIIFLNHGIEILLKYILSKQNESLIFTDINLYMEAKEKLKNESKGKKNPFEFNNKRNVFDVDLGNGNKKKQLYTINLNEAIKRIKFLLDIDISEDVETAITLINDYRNHITHHSIILDEPSVNELVEKIKFLYSHILDFFQEHITERNVMKEVDAERYLYTKQEWEQYQRELEDFHYERAMSRISLDADEM
ncbi:hypothetical protein [Bacillus pumilus]|uniref:hypothetical protein n=1 Tax=Bacillus pumilus TaxID=1408 RepID=UPI000D031E0D|nr:hypothetical protein [Bacillus pumilus]PRS59934.1 hypothetical protein C6X97_16305 [Bacillus pumilus]